MGYVAAGYLVTLGGLGAYAFWLARRASRLSRERGR